MSCIRGISLFTLIAMCLAIHTQAAIIPVIEDFDDGVADGFTNVSGAGAVWTTAGGVHQVKLTAAASGSTSSSLIQITSDIPSLGGFVMETDVRVTGYSSGGANGIDIGVVAFSDTGTATRYLLDFNPSKQTVRILGFDGVAPTPVAFTYDPNEIYHLSMAGTYSGGTLNVTATFVDPSMMAPIAFTVSDTTPLTGVSLQGWGYRARAGSTNSNGTIQFDNFSVIPEPSSVVIALGCVGLAALGVRRRGNDASSTRD